MMSATMSTNMIMAFREKRIDVGRNRKNSSEDVVSRAVLAYCVKLVRHLIAMTPYSMLASVERETEMGSDLAAALLAAALLDARVQSQTDNIEGILQDYIADAISADMENATSRDYNRPNRYYAAIPYGLKLVFNALSSIFTVETLKNFESTLIYAVYDYEPVRDRNNNVTLAGTDHWYEVKPTTERLRIPITPISSMVWCYQLPFKDMKILP